MKNNLMKKVIIATYLFAASYFIQQLFFGDINRVHEFLFNIPMTAIPLITSLYIIYNFSKKIFKNKNHKLAILFIVIALFAWSTGNGLYIAYRLLAGIDSSRIIFADGLYYLTMLTWTVGLAFVQFMIKRKKFVLRALVRFITIFILLIAYVLFAYSILNGRPSFPYFPNTVNFFIVYVMPNILILFEVGLLGYVVLYEHVQMKKILMYFTLGFAIHYIADVEFLSTTGIFLAPLWIDFLFLTAVTLESFGALELFKLKNYEN
ncbi:MAG: hypothetical protein KIH89_000520 [Candidatus Shapirobacteria bacterium]|nr:hypothetical protein [Candidatus Shapirobacteria bacterium]